MRTIRFSIICITFILIMFGVIMVYSSSAIYAEQTLGDDMFFLKRHLFSLTIGLVSAFLLMAVDTEIIKENARPFLVVVILALIAVFIPGLGKTAGGARRWIYLGFLNIQPSEVSKIALIIYIAYYVDKYESRLTNLFSGYIPAMSVISFLMFLVILEPDLGSTVTLGFAGIIMLFIAGVKLRHLVITVFSALPLLIYLVFSVPYRRNRILAFINPWADERGTGFQIVQSFIALGSGGLTGVGIGQSKQKLFFLPASHTDFIFSIIGEELGFIGAVLVVLLFMSLLWQGGRAAFKTEDVFKKMIIFGIIFTIAFEVLVNIGVSCGIVPTKGLPLPFISYGGTSLVVHIALIGLLLNATREQ